MNIVKLLSASALAASALIAPAMAAPNLVQNGGFETTSQTGNFEFGAAFPQNQTAVADWSSPSTNAYNLLFNPATAFTPAGNAQGQYSYTGKEYLQPGGGTSGTALATASPDGGNFVGIDGDPNFNGPVQQQIAGLVVGKTYTLSFDWAAGQVASRTGQTSEQLQVSLGGAPVYSTAVVTNPSAGFTGWFTESTTFVASGSSELLSFLSVGTPSGLPPIALLDGVSITQNVPEPAALALFGLGLAGLGASRLRRR